VKKIIPQILFWVAVVSMVLGIIFKLANVDFPTSFYPLTYLRFSYACLLFAIAWIMIFLKGKE